MHYCKSRTNTIQMKNNSILFTLILSILFLAGCSTKLGYRTSQIAKGSKGMVVSAHPLASDAGKQILMSGGNATDAAIAVQFALAVVCPRAGNLGGGGFWMYAPIGDQVRALDYREEAPSAATRDMYLTSEGEVHPTKSLEGPLAAGIPGQVDGLWMAYTLGSKQKDWKALLQPAIILAEEGFRISVTEANRLNRFQEAFKRQNDFPFPFVKDTPWVAGDLLQQTQLAKTLRGIAEEGPGYFYDSGFAKALAEEIRNRGGIWTAEDLSNYQSVWRKAISYDFQGHTVHSMPPPSSGGVVLSQMLGMLKSQNLQSVVATDSIAYFHLLIESMRRAYQDRATYLGDPDQVSMPIDSILSDAYLNSKWSTYSPDKATPSGTMLNLLGKETYETTHTSVVDQVGNAISVTTTLNGNFGCKVWSKTGGFFLNNEMDDFSAKPGVPNQFGLIGGEANAIAPGKRMLSSMTPTIVQANGKTELVLGSPGGSTIITAVLQVMLNDLVFGETLEGAVARPRIHHQWLPDEVIYETGVMSDDVRQGLEAKGHTFRKVNSIGRVKAIGVLGSKITGVGDARNPDDDASGY